MPFRLRMPGQLGDWLADLAGSQPEAAAETGAALLVLLQADQMPGPPLVAQAGRQPDPRETLDFSYQQMLEGLQRLRELAADASTIRESAELRAQRTDLDAPGRAEAERELDAARRREEELSARSSLAQRQVDGFRSQKETAKALATAADARRRVLDAFAALGQHSVDDEASAERAAAESAARVEQALVAAERALGREDVRGYGASEVLELRADPLGADVRLLFAEEPRGTVTLLTVLEGTDAAHRHRRDAADLAAELLDEIRAGNWPAPIGEALEFADASEFLPRFFRVSAADVTERAAGLAGATSLAGLREQRGVSAAELARQIGSSEQQVQAAEQDSLADTDRSQVAAHVRALGGTLYLMARFGDEQRRII